MNKWSIVLADDEPNAREFLTRLVQEHEQLELMAALNNGLDVLKYCRTHSPDILLLDIEMPGLNGIETAKRLVDKKQDTIIIFITAFDQYAVEAFDLMAIGYLLKPYVKDDFTSVLSRAIENLNNKQKLKFGERIERLWEHYNKPKKAFLDEIEIKERGLIAKIDIKDILYIQADSEYIRIYTALSMHLKRQSLSMIASQLPESFRQVHRTFVINLDRIKGWKYLNNGTYQFDFENDRVVTSSRSYQELIRKCLPNNANP